MTEKGKFNISVDKAGNVTSVSKDKGIDWTKESQTDIDAYYEKWGEDD